MSAPDSIVDSHVVGEWRSSGNGNPIAYDELPVTTMLDICGFLEPSGVLDTNDLLDRHEHALETLWEYAANLRPAKREVLLHNARTCMEKTWDWKNWEAREAVKNVCSLSTLGVQHVLTDFSPRSLSDVLSDPDLEGDADWLVPGYAGRGVLTLVSGHPKVGKTTFLAHLARSVAAGESFLGQRTQQAPVLWLDLEQHPRHTAALFRGVTSDDLPISLYNGKHQFTDEQLSRYVTDNGIGLIVIDSLSKFWNLTDENDAAQVTPEIGRLLTITRETEVGVIAIHHLRKSEGNELTDVRGSGALNAAVDVSVAIRRHKQGGDQARELEAISRYEQTPDRVVVELIDGTYHRRGTVKDVARERNLAKILEVLTEEPMNSKDLAEASGVARPTVTKLLNAEYENGRVFRDGTGKPRSAFRFYGNAKFLSEQTKPLIETDDRLSDAELEARYDELGAVDG